jgi:hypothetical protein
MTLSIRHAWSKLEKERADEDGYVRIRVSSQCPHALYAALHRPSSMPAIMLELATASIPAGLQFPQTVGLRVHAQPVQPGPHGRPRIIVELTRRIYGDVFEILAEDVCRKVHASASESEAAQQLVSRLSNWQTFLRRYAPDGLSPEAQAGLFGELWFLKSWLLNVAAPTAAISSWTGPDAANQDFQLRSVGVEVKVTRAAPHERLFISNVRQLDATGVDALLLLHLSFDVRREGDQTLPWLVNHLTGLLSRQDMTAADLFHSKLSQAGYLASQADLYDDIAYALRHHCFYTVVDGFPRLLETDLPTGVGDVRYSIAVSAMHGFTCADAQALGFLRGAADGR